MSKGRKAAAELIGTFWLVFGGCGAAVLAGHHLDWLGVSFAFGLTVVSMAYAVGHISGCHLNPAVSLGLVAAGREKPDILATYVPAQCLGALLATVAIVVIGMGAPEASFDSMVKTGLAANGYGDHSPMKYGMGAAFLAETLLTFFFLMVILGATDKRSNPALAGLIIGLALTLIHMVGIPVTNLSVNPARSLGPAIVVRDWAIAQVWLFWVAPLAGAAIAGVAYKCLADDCPPSAPAPPTA